MNNREVPFNPQPLALQGLDVSEPGGPFKAISVPANGPMPSTRRQQTFPFDGMNKDLPPPQMQQAPQSQAPMTMGKQQAPMGTMQPQPDYNNLIRALQGYDQE